jgi:hypothetical protein
MQLLIVTTAQSARLRTGDIEGFRHQAIDQARIAFEPRGNALEGIS